jgi:hypothetical protein
MSSDSAPMTGPGGRWRPVSELPEVGAAAHFAALAEAGRESCPGFCPVCAARDAAPETCANCGLPIEDSHKIEFAPGAFRAVTVFVHAGTGLEQCETGGTAPGRTEPEGERQ